MRNWIQKLACASLTAGLLSATNESLAADVKILNVSYDVTREFYQDYNAVFAAYWKEKTGDTVTVNQSHGGSSKQAQSVVNGLEADVVTMNQPPDIDILHTSGGLIPANWATRLPNKSVPYTSTIVFVVRKDNPKNIRNWDDLVQSNVSVVIPNPKTSGNGRYSYLAAWGYALKKSAGDEKQAREFVAKLFANVPVLDTGGRGATTTFADRGIGDVLLTFENEAALVQKQFPDDGLLGGSSAREHSCGKSRGLGGSQRAAASYRGCFARLSGISLQRRRAGTGGATFFPSEKPNHSCEVFHTFQTAGFVHGG